MLLEGGETATISNGAFVDNHNTGLGQAGAGVLHLDAALLVRNTILWDNSADATIVDAQVKAEAPGAQLSVVYSCVQDDDPNLPPITGAGNIDEDPLFVDAPNGDFRLSALSPCIDRGVNALSDDYGDLDDDDNENEKTPLDLALATRVVDGLATIDDLTLCDGIVDMGAYEYRFGCGACILGDINKDAVVDGRDIDPFVACLLGSSGCECACADIRGSNGVGVEDIVCFVTLVLSGGADRSCVQNNCDFLPPGCPYSNETAVQMIVSGALADCNDNLIPDVCEIDENSVAPGGPYYCQSDCVMDQNNDGIPDTCQPDCNGNGTPDDLDIAAAVETDCNGNGIPDSCASEQDLNGNGVPDECDILARVSADCDGNGVPDEADPDCDGDGTPDACQPLVDCNGSGVFDACETDCDGDGLPGDCELSWNDCNGNHQPDDCEINRDPPWNLPDCNNNGVPDECELSGADCNGNGVLDACDISMGLSADSNANGIPDECEGAPMAPMTRGAFAEFSTGGYPGFPPGVPVQSVESERWTAYMTWCAATDFSDMTIAEKFEALLAKRLELGLPAGQLLPTP